MKIDFPGKFSFLFSQESDRGLADEKKKTDECVEADTVVLLQTGS